MTAEFENELATALYVRAVANSAESRINVARYLIESGVVADPIEHDEALAHIATLDTHLAAVERVRLPHCERFNGANYSCITEEHRNGLVTTNGCVPCQIRAALTGHEPAYHDA